MTAVAIETDLRASLDELARACRILEMRISLDFLRKNGHNRVNCCVFVASLYSHLSEIPGEDQDRCPSADEPGRTATARRAKPGSSPTAIMPAPAGSRASRRSATPTPITRRFGSMFAAGSTPPTAAA